MFQEFLETTLLPSLLGLAAIGVTTLTGIAAAAVRQWGAKQRAVWARTVTDEAMIAVENAVGMTNQTFVDALRVKSADGKLTPEEARVAMYSALDAARLSLGREGMAALAKILGGDELAEKALGVMVESVVRDQKPPPSERPTSGAFMATGG